MLDEGFPVLKERRLAGVGRLGKMVSPRGDVKKRGKTGPSIGSVTQRCKARRTSRGAVSG